MPRVSFTTNFLVMRAMQSSTIQHSRDRAPGKVVDSGCIFEQARICHVHVTKQWYGTGGMKRSENIDLYLEENRNFKLRHNIHEAFRSRADLAFLTPDPDINDQWGRYFQLWKESSAGDFSEASDTPSRSKSLNVRTCN